MHQTMSYRNRSGSVVIYRAVQLIQFLNWVQGQKTGGQTEVVQEILADLKIYANFPEHGTVLYQNIARGKIYPEIESVNLRNLLNNSISNQTP